jgi:hypothetical protein
MLEAGHSKSTLLARGEGKRAGGRTCCGWHALLCGEYHGTSPSGHAPFGHEAFRSAQPNMLCVGAYVGYTAAASP